MRNNRQLGTKKEQLACEYLKKQGYVILDCNYRNRYGEIDIVAKEGTYLCFIEVKYRSSFSCGEALEAVTCKKQKTIMSVANYYCMKHNLGLDVDIRFDVVGIQKDEIILIRNAFGGLV